MKRNVCSRGIPSLDWNRRIVLSPTNSFRIFYRGRFSAKGKTFRGGFEMVRSNLMFKMKCINRIRIKMVIYFFASKLIKFLLCFGLLNCIVPGIFLLSIKL